MVGFLNIQVATLPKPEVKFSLLIRKIKCVISRTVIGFTVHFTSDIFYREIIVLNYTSLFQIFLLFKIYFN